MSGRNFALQHRVIGRAAAWTVFLLEIGYIVTTILGLLSLKSPQEPIGDPFFSIMEILILGIAPLMVVSMVAVHIYAPLEGKIYSLTALILMTLMAGITSCVHFTILTISRPLEAIGFTGIPWLFSFEWPSVAYALDILAWDWFFALSMLLAAPIFQVGKLEITVQILMIVSGVLSLAGLIGVPMANMQIRNVGILGYGVVASVVFLLLGILLGRSDRPPDNTTYRSF